MYVGEPTDPPLGTPAADRPTHLPPPPPSPPLQTPVLAKLSLGMQEKIYLLKTWVLPCVLLAARAYFPDDRVVAEMRSVPSSPLLVVVGTHIGEPSETGVGGGLCAAPPPPHVYLHWVHSGAFLTAMQEPHRFDEQVLSCLRRWASSVGLVLDMCFLRFLQLAPVRHNNMGFLACSVRSFSTARSQYQDLPLPVSYEKMPV